MKSIVSVFALACIALSATLAEAHSLWVNIYESTMHVPSHVMVMVGNGHKLPVDDFLTSGKTCIPLSKYYVVGPDGKQTNLTRPAADYRSPIANKDTGITSQSGDLGMNKLTFKGTDANGTYEVVASIEDKYFSMFIDSKGKMQHSLKAMNTLPKGVKILRGLRFVSNAKGFFAREKWTQPVPRGFEMEIVPETDLSSVHTGDIVKFKVLMNGKPLSSDFKGVEYITAHSPSYGDPDKFCLMSMLMKGKGQFRMPAAGQWMVKVNVERKIDDTPAFSAFKGKAETAYYAATYTFNVRP